MAERRAAGEDSAAAVESSLAGPVTRALAFGIDYGVLLLLESAFFLGYVLLAFSGGTEGFAQEWSVHFEFGEAGDLGSGLAGWAAIAVAIQVAIECGYFFLSEVASGGRSIGKWALGLRVVEAPQRSVTVRGALLRNLLRVLDQLPVAYALGAVFVTLRRDHRRIGDLVAGTFVVRDSSADRAPELGNLARGDRSVDGAFGFEPAGLSRIGAEETQLIRGTLLRSETLPPGEAERVLRRAVEVLEERLERREPVAAADRRAFLVALLRAAEAMAQAPQSTLATTPPGDPIRR